jgi:hypothetical protein
MKERDCVFKEACKYQNRKCVKGCKQCITKQEVDNGITR